MKALTCLFWANLAYLTSLVLVSYGQNTFNSFDLYLNRAVFYFKNSFIGFAISFLIFAFIFRKAIRKKQSFLKRFVWVFIAGVLVAYFTALSFFTNVIFLVDGGASISFEVFRQLTQQMASDSLQGLIYSLPVMLLSSVLIARVYR